MKRMLVTLSLFISLTSIGFSSYYNNLNLNNSLIEIPTKDGLIADLVWPTPPIIENSVLNV